MATNDLLYLIVQPHSSEDGVRWDRLSNVVVAVEHLLGEALTHIVSHRHFLAEPAREVPTPKAVLAGTVQVGSILVPLSFELLELGQILGKALKAGMEQKDTISVVLSGLSDATSIIQFARDLVFGERGTIARRSGQAPTRSAASAYEEAIDTMAPEYIDRLEKLTLNLMTVAGQTGCKVELRVNDQSSVNITPGNVDRSSTLLGRNFKVGAAVGSDLLLQRVSESVFRVSHQDQVYPAFLAELGGTREHGTQVVTVVWASSHSVPQAGEGWNVEGQYIDRNEVSAQDSIPEEMQRAGGILLVRHAKPVEQMR